MIKARAFAMAAAVFSAVPLGAQSYFGKNQVQYDHFKWQVFETEHFFIHYYPSEAVAARDAARMAERAYARLSKVLGHEFREKKPIALFASRSDFAQNNVTGDLGEGVGGVTEAIRHRILLPFTGDYASFEQVLAHELVHEFQYDVFARGKAGNGLQVLAQINPPLWFMEGMAEYLSIGPHHPHTATWIRDAALNGNLPTIEQMTKRPDRFFPYRYGEALWAYIGRRWGDEVIGPILHSATTVGVERAIKREIGRSLDDLSDEWREAMQLEHLPQIARLDRARRFASPLLTEKRSGGEIFLAPALSSDGEHIAFLSNGSFARGEVFIDLWLGNARTGQRIKRLVKSTTDPNAEELRLLYSQSSFSPDGKYLAYTAQRKGRDVLYILDVARVRNVRRLDLPLEGVTGPSWSPDGKRLVFTGYNGGLSDLYIVDADGRDLRRLTSDRHGDLQPQWSPDGSTIAFASDRGSLTNFDQLRFSRWVITLYSLASGRLEVLPDQDGLNINPMWAPDGKSIAYVSSRTGIQNIFLFDLEERRHYQLTNVVGGVTAVTEYSPAITWAHRADRLAFAYFENGEYTVWSVANPRLLKKAPYQSAPPQIAGAARLVDDTARTAGFEAPLAAGTAPAGAAAATPQPANTPQPDVAGADTTARAAASLYRTQSGFRPSDELPPAAAEGSGAGALSVSAVLDSMALSLPDTGRFKRYSYRVRFSPDYVARPSIGYARDNFGRGIFGGTTIILSDLLANHHLAFSGEINGSVSESRGFAAYTNLSRRLQYSAGIYQQPQYFAQGYFLSEDARGGPVIREDQILTRYIERQAFGIGIYPLNRFTRAEFGMRLTHLQRSDLRVSRLYDRVTGEATYPQLDTVLRLRPVAYVQPYAAFVSDNVIWGLTAPIMGRRFRFQAEPTVGRFRTIEYLADYRRYDPIIFNTLTVATRVMASVSSGRDADSLRKYLGYPDLIRGYERNTFPTSRSCLATERFYRCSPLLGSRVLVANAELRFPLLRRADLGLIPIPLPPVEAVVFYDAAAAWFPGQRLHLGRRAISDPMHQRSLLTSHGLGIRVNLFNFAVLRWDYVWPHDAPGRRRYWQFSLGPSF